MRRRNDDEAPELEICGSTEPPRIFGLAALICTLSVVFNVGKDQRETCRKMVLGASRFGKTMSRHGGMRAPRRRCECVCTRSFQNEGIIVLGRQVQLCLNGAINGSGVGRARQNWSRRVQLEYGLNAAQSGFLQNFAPLRLRDRAAPEAFWAAPGW